jgi:hypothetical protein
MTNVSQIIITGWNSKHTLTSLIRFLPPIQGDHGTTMSTIARATITRSTVGKKVNYYQARMNFVALIQKL